jgi:ABC-type uncharacterized transport system permease subunit
MLPNTPSMPWGAGGYNPFANAYANLNTGSIQECSLCDACWKLILWLILLAIVLAVIVIVVLWQTDKIESPECWFDSGDCSNTR